MAILKHPLLYLALSIIGFLWDAEGTYRTLFILMFTCATFLVGRRFFPDKKKWVLVVFSATLPLFLLTALSVLT